LQALPAARDELLSLLDIRRVEEPFIERTFNDDRFKAGST
jgi:hypothetical protein